MSQPRHQIPTIPKTPLTHKQPLDHFSRATTSAAIDELKRVEGRIPRSDLQVA